MGLVYSTELGRLCPQCGQAKHAGPCKKVQVKPSVSGAVKIWLEKKGRKGAGVSVIENLAMDETELKNLAKFLKAKCGVGGSIKDGKIEIQGDQRDKLILLLAEKGIQAKKAGG